MPQCKAKFCTVKRGQGISTFPIPDPTKNKELCEQWIHKLGIENLNIKTFKFSRDSIVCAKHFEEQCFKEDVQAKIMGYTPKYKFLKADAIPTIFEDTEQTKGRESSKNRFQKKERQEMVEEMLKNDFGESTNSSFEEIMSRNKRKHEKQLSGKQKQKKEMTKCVDVAVQTQTDVSNMATSCNISSDFTYNDCPNCYARENPTYALNDHSYTDTAILETENRVIAKTPTKKVNTTEENVENMEDNEDFEFNTPEKEYRDDLTYKPVGSYDASPIVSQHSASLADGNQSKNFVEEKKFIVFSSCLVKLFGMVVCIDCKDSTDIDDIRYRFDGTCVTASLTCLKGHTLVWRSQPVIDQQPVGNILTTAASLISGGTYSMLDNFASVFQLLFLSRTTFHKIENELVIPAIDDLYNQQKNIITRGMSGQDLFVSGDGRCDSPGYSAKYCTYTIMEDKTSAILGFNVIQVTETNNSSTKMELKGLIKTMENIQFDGLSVITITTDRHVQIRKYIKNEFPHIAHQFDVWHMAKSIRKKLLAAAKKKGNEDLMPWVRSISNHLWYCASHCKGNADLLVEMWMSIVMHIQNIHLFEGKLFLKCGHNELSFEESRRKKMVIQG